MRQEIAPGGREKARLWRAFSYFEREKVSAWELSGVRVLRSQNTLAGGTKFRGRLDFHGPRELAFVLGDKVELVGQLGGKSMERLFVT